jgi:hypothetical protein
MIGDGFTLSGAIKYEVIELLQVFVMEVPNNTVLITVKPINTSITRHARVRGKL